MGYLIPIENTKTNCFIWIISWKFVSVLTYREVSDFRFLNASEAMDLISLLLKSLEKMVAYKVTKINTTFTH